MRMNKKIVVIKTQIKRYGREGNEIMILKELSPEAERERKQRNDKLVLNKVM